MPYHVGYFVGSLSSNSLNRKLAQALIAAAPDDLEFTEISIAELPLYSPDYDADYPETGRTLKRELASVEAVLFVTPEYNRSIPGALKNAIDWASRPSGTNSFDHLPTAVVGASPGKIGTALGQQALRAILSYCNARQMTAPEAYVQINHDEFDDSGRVLTETTRDFLADFMGEFHDHIVRVLTVLPRN